MKKIFLLIFMIPMFSFSQELQSYLASEGYSTALAAAEGRLDNPVLTSVAVNIGFSLEVPILGEVEIEFDQETGESNLFAYIFCDANNRQETALIPVISTFFGFQDASDFSDELEVSPEEFNELVGQLNVSETWIDSDEFITSLNSSSEHQNYSSQYSGAELSLVVLANDEFQSSPTYGNTLWVAQYRYPETDELAYLCGMDALSKDVLCQEDFPGSVQQLTDLNSKVGPNPAKDFLNIELDRNINFTEIFLVDIFGNQISADFAINSGSSLNVNTSNLNMGTYFVKIVTNNNTYVTKFIKSE